jgi:positive phototaxis protein PixI
MATPIASQPAFLQTWLAQGDQTSSGSSGSQLSEPPETVVRFLRFYFSSQDMALLPLRQIQEVMQVPSQSVIPVPEMPESVLGICQGRGTVLWLIDLGTLLGFPTCSLQGYYAPESGLVSQSSLLTTLALHAEGEQLGLVVPAVVDIEDHAAQQIQPLESQLFPSHLLPFLEGYLPRSCSPILSARAVVEALQDRGVSGLE